MNPKPMIGPVPGSVTLGNRSFPARANYETYFLNKGAIQSREELWSNPELVAEVQRHWHSCGQNGCIFAQQISRTADPSAWQRVVFTQSTITPAVLNEVSNVVHSAIENPGCEIVSLLFPQVVTDLSLASLLRQLLTVSEIHLAGEADYGELVTISLRVVINQAGSLSWLMGFGPFDFLPATRHAPVTEIAVRCRSKPEEQFHRLNHDPMAAHLADYPLRGDEASTEKIWQATLRNTEVDPKGWTSFSRN